jgi:thiol-disulfide isomerase/thioredoxin
MMKFLTVLFTLSVLPHILVAREGVIDLHVRNAPEDTPVLITAYTEPITWRQETFCTAVPDEKGHVHRTFSIARPLIAEIHLAEQYAKIYLEPGMNLKISLDYEDFDASIRFEGPTAANQRYLLAELLQDFQTPQMQYTLFTDAQDYRRFIDSVQESHRQFYRSSDTANMTPVFREYVRMTIEYQYHYARNMFSVVYDPITSQFSERELPDQYYEFLKELDLTQNAYAADPHYFTAIDLYLHRFVINDQTDVRRSYGRIAGALDGHVRDVHLASYLRRNLNRLEGDQALGDSLVADYSSRSRSPHYADIVAQSWDLVKRLAPGNLLPDFSVIDANGAERKLSDLRGSVLYVDLWATWCMPCIASMKASAELRKEMTGQNITFVYICLDDAEERWKAYQNAHDLGPHTWFADADRSQSIRSLFAVDGIPRYMIVDKDGRMVRSQAPGPDRARDLLLELSQK